MRWQPTERRGRRLARADRQLRGKQVPTHPETWVNQYGDYLFRFALSRLRQREEAEDLVQETFLAAFSALGKFAGRLSERRWLVGILNRKLLDYLRREGREQPTGATRRPRNLASAIVGPVLEQLARRTPQTPASVFRPALAAVDHRLKIAFQVGPALQTSQVPVHLRPIAVENPAKRLAQKVARRPHLAGGTHRKTVNVRATNVRSHALPSASLVPVSSMFNRSCASSCSPNASCDGRDAVVTWFWVFTVSDGQHGCPSSVLRNSAVRRMLPRS